MSDRTKTLEQEAALYEFDAQGYSLSGKPLGTDRVLIVRMEDGRARFTTRELDGSIALGQLQLGTAAAEEILRLIAAAAARDKEMRQLRLLAEEQLTTLRKLKAEMLSDTRDKEIEELRARVKELEGMVPRWTKASSDECRQLCIDGWAFVSGTRAMDGRCLMVPPIPLPEGE